MPRNLMLLIRKIQDIRIKVDKLGFLNKKIKKKPTIEMFPAHLANRKEEVKHPNFLQA